MAVERNPFEVLPGGLDDSISDDGADLEIDIEIEDGELEGIELSEDMAALALVEEDHYANLAEYLDDDNYSSVTFFTDLMDALKDWKEYHHKKLEKVNLAMSLITGDTPSPVGDFSLSDRSIIQFNTNYTEEELNAMCDAAQDKEKCREYNLREAEYYNKRAQLDLEKSKYYWGTDRNR